VSQPSQNAVAYKRLFFALWPPLCLQEDLHAAAQQWVARGRGRVLPAENLHLTLAFVGPVDAEREACFTACVEPVRGAPFEIVLDQVGHWRRRGILWVGATQAPEALLALVTSLHAALARCGYQPDPRPFKVHVTVARHVRTTAQRLTIAPQRWRVDSFSLVQSQILPRGAQYETLRRWVLG
jgi:2'-5' RNA ligase